MMNETKEPLHDCLSKVGLEYPHKRAFAVLIIINLKAIKFKENIMKLNYFSLYKQKLLCDNDRRMKSLESILINQLIMAGECLSVRTAALLRSVIRPRPLF